MNAKKQRKFRAQKRIGKKKVSFKWNKSKLKTQTKKYIRKRGNKTRCAYSEWLSQREWMNRRQSQQIFTPLRVRQVHFIVKVSHFLKQSQNIFSPHHPPTAPQIYILLWPNFPLAFLIFSLQGPKEQQGSREQTAMESVSKKKLLMRRTYPIFVNHIWRKWSNVEKIEFIHSAFSSNTWQINA